MNEVKEERVGAFGLPNSARESNKRRYASGQVVYHLKEAEKAMLYAGTLFEGDELDALMDLDIPDVLVRAQAMHDARPLQHGAGLAGMNEMAGGTK